VFAKDPSQISELSGVAKGRGTVKPPGTVEVKTRMRMNIDRGIEAHEEMKRYNSPETS
jgi:hypothetical protein